jgi:hypothetical protein
MFLSLKTTFHSAVVVSRRRRGDTGIGPEVDMEVDQLA